MSRVAEFLGKLSDPTNTVKNLESIVKLFMTESFMSRFVWDESTWNKLPWKDSVRVLPSTFIDFMINERHRQAKKVNSFNKQRKFKQHQFNHQLWMRTLRKKFISAVAGLHSSVI